MLRLFVTGCQRNSDTHGGRLQPCFFCFARIATTLYQLRSKAIKCRPALWRNRRSKKTTRLICFVLHGAGPRLSKSIRSVTLAFKHMHSPSGASRERSRPMQLPKAKSSRCALSPAACAPLIKTTQSMQSTPWLIRKDSLARLDHNDRLREVSLDGAEEVLVVGTQF